MEEKESLFDEYIRSERPSMGGRLDTNTLPDRQYVLQLEQYRTHAQNKIDSFLFFNKNHTDNDKSGLTKPIHFDYTNSALFNAAAFKYEGQYFIGFNYGTVLLVVDAFYRMMSRSDVLVGLGTTDNFNNDHVFPLTNNFNDIINYYNAKEITGFRYTDNEDRAQYASVIVTMALDFLLFHELTHIVQGHLEIKGELGATSMFMEYQEIEQFDKKFTPLDNQLLEFEADNFSAFFTFFDFWHQYKNKQLEFVGDHYSDAPQTHFILTWTLGIWLIFRLTNLSRKASVSFSINATYPSIQVRQLHSIHQAVQNLRISDGVDRASLPNTPAIYHAVSLEAEDIIAKITGQPDNGMKTIPYDVISKQVEAIIINNYHPHLVNYMIDFLKKYSWTIIPSGDIHPGT